MRTKKIAELMNSKDNYNESAEIYNKKLCGYLRLPEGFLKSDYDSDKYGMVKEKITNLIYEIDSFVIKCYEEFFGNEYKEGDVIPENKQEEWSEFIKKKLDEIELTK